MLFRRKLGEPGVTTLGAVSSSSTPLLNIGQVPIGMVVIHIKRGDSDGFLYETSCSVSNDTLIRELVAVWNMRLRLMMLCGAIRDLAKYGVMKKPDKVGLDEIDEEYNGVKIERNPHYLADPTGQRTGNGVGPQVSETIERVARDTESILDKANVDRKVAITLELLQEKLDLIRGAVTIGRLLLWSWTCLIFLSIPHGSSGVGSHSARD